MLNTRLLGAGARDPGVRPAHLTMASPCITCSTTSGSRSDAGLPGHAGCDRCRERGNGRHPARGLVGDRCAVDTRSWPCR
ncbi:hypothetical protein HBB16_11445 [Pseudonocardia sp. MCCB 268]|nr:hypothetical protein [Pseudonocardia cytotoxica]